MTSEASLYESIQEHSEQFCFLLATALKDGLIKIKEHVTAKKFIGTHYDWPMLSFADNGLPRLSSSLFNGEKDYRSLFGSGSDKINDSDLQSFCNFSNFIKSTPTLLDRFLLENWKNEHDENVRGFIDTIVSAPIKDAIERYIHINNTFDYYEEKASIVIEEIKNFIFLETLPIDIIVPILFVNFKFESLTLADGIEIRRLTEKEHLARFNSKAYNVSVHEIVFSSATHALVLTNWEVKNSKCVIDFNTLYDIRAYPLELINKFFASIRLVTNINTGYAQIFSLSSSWIRHCRADLPNIIGTTTRAYPTIFEDYYWNISAIPEISITEITTINSLFKLLRNSTEKSLDIAIRRLNQCLIRDTEEDSVLDATIALEALLSDDSKQEMTHKLAMRVGALVRLDHKFGKTSVQAFRDIKSIYDYRSAIVHGSKVPDKKRVVRFENNTESSVHALAIEYLRFIIKTLLENPKYKNPKFIDTELLLGGN